MINSRQTPVLRVIETGSFFLKVIGGLTKLLKCGILELFIVDDRPDLVGEESPNTPASLCELRRINPI